MSRPIVNIAELPLDRLAKGSRFAVETGEIGQTLGLKGLGAMLHVVPPGHALADKGSATLEDLRQQTLMLLEEGHCLREQALEVCELSGARETMEFRATSLETLRQMVIAGMGVTLLPILATAGLGAGAGGMRLLPFAGSTPNRRIGLVWRQTSPMAGLLRQIAELCRDIAGTQRQLGLTRL